MKQKQKSRKKTTISSFAGKKSFIVTVAG